MIPPEDDDPVPEEDEERDTIQRGWTQAPYSKEAMRKIQDKVIDRRCSCCILFYVGFCVKTSARK